MRPRVFVDTSYFIAILIPGDQAHAAALTLGQRFAADARPLLTTDGILIELGNYLCQRKHRGQASRFISELRRDPAWQILPLTAPLLSRAETRYGRHLDKEWSLTDCISMEVMREARVTEVATADHHFAQAGFRVLLS